MTKAEKIQWLHQQAKKLQWSVVLDSDVATVYRSPIDILDQVVIPKRDDMEGIEVCLEAAVRKLEEFF